MPIEEEYPKILKDRYSPLNSYFPRLYKIWWVNDQNELIRICRYGNLESVQFLVDKGYDVNFVQRLIENEIVTPLNVACSNGHFGIVQFLVENGANVNLGIFGSKPITKACEGEFIEIVKFLVKMGATIGTIDLTIACTIGNLEIVRFILERVNSSQEERRALTIAVANNHLPLVEYLLGRQKELNLDPTLESFEEKTDIGICQLLLDRGARISRRCLNRAVQYNRPDILELFLQEGADPRVLDETFFIRDYDKPEILRFILTLGIYNNYSRYLSTAVRKNFPKTVQFLLENTPIDIKSKNKALLIAQRSNYGEIVQILSENITGARRELILNRMTEY